MLFISLETKKFVQQEPPNFEQLTENGLRALEALGAKNIITKQENFEAQEGVRGMKTFGTADFFIDGDTKATKEDYILLFFGGKGYVQSIGMRWIDGDPYAEEISEKIMGSIAFEKITETPENRYELTRFLCKSRIFVASYPLATLGRLVSIEKQKG